MRQLIIIPICLQIMMSPLANAVQCETEIQCRLMGSNPKSTEEVRAGAVRVGSTVEPGRITSSQRGISNAGAPGTTTSPGASFGGGGSGAMQQAQNAKDDANDKKMMGIMIAAMSAPMCGPQNPMACVMAAAGIALAAMAGGKKDEAQQLQNKLGTPGAGSINPNGTTNPSTTNGAVATDGQLSDLKAKLAAQGFTVDDAGNITNSKGQTANAMNLNTASLKGLGLNSKDAANFGSEFDKQAKEASKNLGIKLASTEGGGGRGGGSSVGATQEISANNAKAESVSLDRNPAAWAGFYKQMGDSLIGVAQSDIFLMIQNRVEVERKPMGQ